jgi:flagellar motor switch protein FliG
MKAAAATIDATREADSQAGSRLNGPGDTGMRKAAILVACLDRAAADAVLAQLSPEQAHRVRQAVVVLDEITPRERESVVEEFYRFGPERPTQAPVEVELAGRLAPQPGPQRSAAGGGNERSGGARAKPFVRLRETEDEKLARLLSDERPQTIALVLSHLPARQAGGVLARLRPELQTEVVRRLVDLEETDPAILQEVEQALESRLSQQVQMQRRRVAGLEAISGILEAADADVRLRIMENLAARDHALSQRLNPPPVDFDDLADLDDGILAEVFRAVDPEWIMPALLGAMPEITERVLRFFPRAQAEALGRKLRQPGPIRLSDIEAARQKIAETATRIIYVKGRVLLNA